MPQAANLTIKNSAGSDKTFTLLTPAPGYGVPAEWALREGATSVAYPTITLAAVKGSNRARKVTYRVKIPATYVSVATGLPVVAASIEMNGSVVVPDDFPDDQKDDAIAYATNFMVDALPKACFRDGLPAT